MSDIALNPPPSVPDDISTGAGSVAVQIFNILLDRGQDFVDRTIAALNHLGAIPSQFIPRVPTVDWTAPAFVDPSDKAGARPIPPQVMTSAAASIIFEWLSDPDPRPRRAYEASTFARAADRATAEGRSRVREARRRWSSRGFEMPPGMVNTEVRRAQEAAQRATLQASFEAMTQAQNLQLEKFKVCISEGLGALTRIYAAEGQVYAADRGADAEVRKAAVAVYEAKVQEVVQRVAVRLKAAEIENQTLLQGVTLLQKAIGDIAATYAQLSAGAMSGLSARAGFEDSSSRSQGFSQSWSYGEQKEITENE